MKTKSTLKEKNANDFLTHTEGSKGITLVALVITIVLNCSFFAMERMLKKEEILKRRKNSIII